ncbi:hypothetical protein [Actinophytocola sediminis]
MASQPDALGPQPNLGGRPTCRSRRHEQGSAPLLAPGLCVCAACRDLAEETLIELPSLFEMCAHVLDLRPNGFRERVSGHRPHGIVLRDAVVSVRSEILGVLASWCGLVISERGMPGPDELAIRKLVGFLGIHLHWLFQHPAAPSLVDELVDLAEAVSAALRPDTGFRVAVGQCPMPDCGQTVHAEAHREGAAPYEVACEAGHVWAPEHWLSLRGRTNGGNRGNGNRGNGTNGDPKGAAPKNGDGGGAEPSRSPHQGNAE